jgi:Ca2+/Na+ antiporter
MENVTNKILSSVFMTVFLFEVIFRSILIYNSSIYYLYIYVFVALVYLLVSIMIVNAISRSIRKNKNEFEQSKFVSKLNTFTLILVVILAGVGYFTKEKAILINGSQQASVDQTKEVPQELNTYIEALNQTIISNIQNDANYQIPEEITDVTFGNPEIELQEVNLKIDEYGTVSSGTMKYKDFKYIYESGVILVQD